MKKVLILTGLLAVCFASLSYAIDSYTTRDVRDPVRLKARLDADFATVAAGVGVAAVTNVTAQTATITATVTPEPGADVTATPSYSYATNILTYLDGDTNTVSWTNIAISGVTIAINNGSGLLTNVTVEVPGVTTNITQETN